MIIKIGNVSLLPWTYLTGQDDWVRWDSYGSNTRVTLRYGNLGPKWCVWFSGGVDFLRPMFEEYGKFGNHKHKHAQVAMDELDKFLIRMGKLTIFT